MTSLLVKQYSETGVLIAGGTSGLGLASAMGFAQAGVRRIALLARNEERGLASAAAVRAAVPDTQVHFFQADATNYEALEAAANAAKEALGSIDVLVNSTSTSALPALFHNTAPGELQTLLTGLAMPPIFLSHIVLPWMRAQQGGSIINVASDAAKSATPGETVIGAGMAAIVMFTRALAIEAKRDGVRVNVLTPSLIAGTPTGDAVLKGGFSKKLFEKAASMAHLGVVTPEDLAPLVVFLGGPGSAKMTGQAISINGGISAA
jgi:NAD(P)-dependent dehydrogenase (short-subunit alcohol dehydrogenase family)